MVVTARHHLRGTGIFAILIAPFLPTSVAAQGLPVETGSHVPVALWFVGAIVLGCAIVYGIMRNKKRSSAEKQLTDRATNENYGREARDR